MPLVWVGVPVEGVWTCLHVEAQIVPFSVELASDLLRYTECEIEPYSFTAVGGVIEAAGRAPFRWHPSSLSDRP